MKKRKIKFLSISFDDKTKIVMSICIVIAVISIMYLIYYLLFKTKHENIISNDIFNINAYEAKYSITVYSNKNTNIYDIEEKADMVNDKYLYITNNGMIIEKDKEDILIKNFGKEFKLKSNQVNNMSNYISFSTVLEIGRKINNNQIDGNIVKRYLDDKIVYEIMINENLFNDINLIKIEQSKIDKCIHYVTMYDSLRNTIFFIDFQEFINKKSQ